MRCLRFQHRIHGFVNPNRLCSAVQSSRRSGTGRVSGLARFKSVPANIGTASDHPKTLDVPSWRKIDYTYSRKRPVSLLRCWRFSGSSGERTTLNEAERRLDNLHFFAIAICADRTAAFGVRGASRSRYILRCSFRI
jgi:hypothetical protein